MPSLSDLVKVKLQKIPNPTTDQINEWAEDIGCSTALIYKHRRKLEKDQPDLFRSVEAGQPIFRAEAEAEEIIEEEPIEEGEEFEPPDLEEEEAEAEEAEEEISVEEEEEIEAVEEDRLREIAGRAIARLFDVAVSDLLALEKVGLSKQESDDTNFLAILMIAKYLKVEVTEYMLEFTSGLHFGSIGLKLVVAWIKKRRAEKKAEEEKPVRTPTPTPKPVEEKTEEESESSKLCVECKKQQASPDSKLGLCVSCLKKAEKSYVNRVGGGR